MKSILIHLWYPVFLISVRLFAEIIYVPSDYQNIQDAINAADQADTVIIAPGIYEEQINITGKNIMLSSIYLFTKNIATIDSTIFSYHVHGENIIYCSGLDSSTVISGLTIGSKGSVCQGIECENASPVIMDNSFKTIDNYGILCRRNSNPTIRENRFLSSNLLYYCIELRHGNAIIQDNVFSGKFGDYSFAIKINSDEMPIVSRNEISNFECGINDYGNRTKIINNLIFNCNIGIRSVDGMLINNTVVDNFNYGIENDMHGTPEIINCIVWGNKKDFFGTFSISNNCMWGCLPYGAVDQGGNVFRDPKFIDAKNNNYRLKGESPCIDAGILRSDLLSEYDNENNNRILDGNGDGIDVIDIGCYESKEARNPAYVSGKITLTGGPGHVEDACVGIGTYVHPGVDGNYSFAISAPDSFYTVSASHDDFLGREINNVRIKAGEITPNIDFNLEYYNPDTLICIFPDTLKFLQYTVCSNDLKLKNVSLLNVYVRGIHLSHLISLDQERFSIPHFVGPGDSCKMPFFVNAVTGMEKRDQLISDSITLFFNEESVKIPIVVDPSLIDGIQTENEKPQSFYVSHNFPNPFNMQTTIELIISIKSDVRIDICNSAGQKVRSIKKYGLNAGKHLIAWDGKDENGNTLSTGLYHYKITDGHNQQVHKMLLLK